MFNCSIYRLNVLKMCNAFSLCLSNRECCHCSHIFNSNSGKIFQCANLFELQQLFNFFLLSLHLSVAIIFLASSSLSFLSSVLPNVNINVERGRATEYELDSLVIIVRCKNSTSLTDFRTVRIRWKSVFLTNWIKLRNDIYIHAFSARFFSHLMNSTTYANANNGRLYVLPSANWMLSIALCGSITQGSFFSLPLFLLFIERLAMKWFISINQKIAFHSFFIAISMTNRRCRATSERRTNRTCRTFSTEFLW